jgi:hypothetical protein
MDPLQKKDNNPLKNDVAWAQKAVPVVCVAQGAREIVAAEPAHASSIAETDPALVGDN